MAELAASAGQPDRGSPGTEDDFPGRLTNTDRILLVLVLSITFIVYSGTIGYDFVYDDRAQILENQYIKSWRYVSRYFTGHVWSYQNAAVLGNYYRPIFLLWLRANHALFGLTPWKWHLVNVLCHVFVTFLVYLLIRRFVKDRLTTALATAIFGLHPVHVEVVAWVSGVPEMLLAMLFIPAFLCYARYRATMEAGGLRARGWLAASLGLYAPAMLAKETALVLPGFLLAYDWIYMGPERTGSRATLLRRSFRSISPYLALSAVYLVARAVALKGLTHPLTMLPSSTVFFTLPLLLVFYLGLLLWPVGLSVFYDVSYVTRPGLLDFVLPTLALMSAGFLIWILSRGGRDRADPPVANRQAVWFAVIWLVLPVLPVLDIAVFYEGDFAHDRYLYLPSVGFSILVALALGRLNVGAVRVLGRSLIRLGAAVVLAALLALGAVYQNAYWVEEVVLYHHAHQVAPNNLVATVNLANVAARRGMYPAAIRLNQSVLARKADFWLVIYNLAYIHYKVGNFQEAERLFRRAIALNPSEPDQYVWLGLTRFKQGYPDEAIALIGNAIRVRPEAYGYHFALGAVLESKGDLKGALEEFRLELANDPEQVQASKQIARIEERLHPHAEEAAPAGQSRTPAIGAH